MFETKDWSDVEDNTEVNPANFADIKISKKSRSRKRKKQIQDIALRSTTSLPNVNAKVKRVTTKLVTSKSKDKLINSPSLTKSLINRDKTEENIENKKPKIKKGTINIKSLMNKKSEQIKVENILTKGIKFTSESNFLKFINQQPKKRKRSKKNKKLEYDKKQQVEDTKLLNTETETAINAELVIQQTDNTVKNQLDIDSSISNKATNGVSPHTGFNVDKLSKLLHGADNERPCNEDSEAKRKLKSSRFRFLNERLYTQSGGQSYKMFKNDREGVNTFKTYHEGYAEQVKKWPMDPLDLIISSIMKRSCEMLVIADFGCGEARLAHALSSSCKKIHSFDLVALNDKVTVCDFSRTPLENESIDIVVFCLSLMGTNLRDYIKEANRVLKMGGVLKVAEVESRFEGATGVQDFIDFVEKMGFGLKWKDLNKEYFNLFDFKKNKHNKKKAPEFELKPCIYKKR